MHSTMRQQSPESVTVTFVNILLWDWCLCTMAEACVKCVSASWSSGCILLQEAARVCATSCLLSSPKGFPSSFLHCEPWYRTKCSASSPLTFVFLALVSFLTISIACWLNFLLFCDASPWTNPWLDSAQKTVVLILMQKCKNHHRPSALWQTHLEKTQESVTRQNKTFFFKLPVGHGQKVHY